jgi:hypothetical protein
MPRDSAIAKSFRLPGPGIAVIAKPFIMKALGRV